MHIAITCSTIVLFLFGVCLSEDPSNWLGTFNIDESCNQNECCCLTEQATITKASDTQLLVSANVAGVPCREQLNGSTTIAVLIPIPTDKSGFQITTNFLGTNNRFTLNSDSQYIANVNLQYPKCSGAGRRVNSNWVGTFRLDDSCLQTDCCCLIEQVKISKVTDTQLLVAANVAGATCGSQLNGTGSIEIPIPMPQDKHGFQITTLFVGSNNRFTLTYDNEYIANVNLQVPKCSGMARRSSS
jgi:hypothetical protein